MNIDGINVNYYDKGSGEAVLFLHGWGCSHTLFAGFLDGMAAHYRVCAPDLPGFGGSDEPPEAWGVGDYVDFTLKFLEALQIQKIIVIGHSFGGRIIIKLAGEKAPPVEIAKIVLVDSAGIRPKKTTRQKAKQLVYSAGKQLLSTEPVKRAFPELLEKWRGSHGSADYRGATPRMRECLVKAVNEDLTPLLSDISCPALLVWGENDTATPVSDAKIMEQFIPDAGLVVLENAGHYSFLDQPYVFGRVLDSFLNITR